MSRSGVKGKRSLAQRIPDAAKGQKTGIGCDRGRTHKNAFSPPFNGGFAPPLTIGGDQHEMADLMTGRRACHRGRRLLRSRTDHHNMAKASDIAALGSNFSARVSAIAAW
jgi:hypothetical protein